MSIYIPHTSFLLKTKLQWVKNRNRQPTCGKVKWQVAAKALKELAKVMLE